MSNASQRSQRTVVFVSGSEHAGKSRLGQMLGTYERALYSYATPAPDDYFDGAGRLLEPAARTAALFRQAVEGIGYNLGGGVTNGRRWLGTDQLLGYDTERFASMVSQAISTELDVGGFYALFDRALTATREEGSDTAFTVLETELMHAPGLLRAVRRALPSARFFVVMRDPTDQYASLKADLIVRGPPDPAYAGALAQRSNRWGLYIESMEQSISRLRAVNRSEMSGAVHTVRFEKLRHLQEAQAVSIAEFVLGKGHEEVGPLAKHIERVSDPAVPLTSRYLRLEPDSQSFYRPERQQHLPLRFGRGERHLFISGWEAEMARLHTPVYEHVLGSHPPRARLTAAVSLMRLPAINLRAAVQGPREVRRRLTLVQEIRRRVRLRRRFNALRVSWRASRWLVSHYLRMLIRGREAN